MMNALLQVKRDKLKMMLEFRDPSTGQLIVTAHVDWTSVGDSIAKGGMEHYPTNAQIELHTQPQAGEPTNTERRTHLIECPALPEKDEEARARQINDILRPYEINGWKAMPGQLGDRRRIKRVLAGGLELYEVDFVKHTFAVPVEAKP